MMKVKFKIVILGILTTILVATWLPNFIVGQPALAKGDETQSTIAGIEVGDLKDDELKDVLSEAINQWTKETGIVSGGGSSLSLNRATIAFDIDSTIATYKSLVKKDWYAFWQSDRIVHLPINTLDSQVLKDEIAKMATWETDETYARVMTAAGYLKTEPVEAVVADLTDVETDRLALAIEEIPVTALGVYDIANVMNGTIVNTGEIFSFIEALGTTIEEANSEALNFVASMLYHNALHMDTDIVERYSQKQVPNYLEPGVEVAIDVKTPKDLKFVNRTANPMKLKMTVENQQLKAEVYTTHKEVDVTMKVVRDEAISPRTITRYTDQLTTGQTQEVQKGVQGLRVSVYRTIHGAEELISRDYYAPINRILLKSSRESSTQTDPDLQMDLDGDGLEDVDSTNTNDDQVKVDENGNRVLPPGSHYDKGGNLITP
ncbi:VanW family protein [Lysinibacillus sp. KU-BSD001]|uniref:VanW family protein n=1 Tax=Lysinibacillus sp. KU-BSD001 TaxID=3141328 RepID=UPI0036E7C061